jgi:MFS transporter, PAT family, beta-lactamase induction signal transducer AmpG
MHTDTIHPCESAFVSVAKNSFSVPSVTSVAHDPVFIARRWVGLVLLGFASGLPLALSSDLLAAWLTDAGFKPDKIGLLGLAALPYALKVIWSPLADRFAPPVLGRRRGWMLITQFLLIGAIFILSTTDPRRSLLATALAATAVAFLSATQDIIVDAWRADVLDADQRGPGAAVSISAYRVGMIASGAGALILVGRYHLSWPTACRLIAMTLGAGIAGTLAAPEPPAQAPPKSLADAVWHPLENLLARPGGLLVLLFILVFKLPEHLANAMSLPFLLQIGLPQDEIGTVRQALGVGVTIGGALLGGAIVQRLGIWRSLWVFGLLHSVSNLCFLALAETGPRYGVLVAVIGVENLCIGLTTAGLIAWMIGQCDARYSAFQFALLSSVMALGRVLASPLAGWLADLLGWPGFFAVSALFGLPGLCLLPFLKFTDNCQPPTAN